MDDPQGVPAGLLRERWDELLEDREIELGRQRTEAGRRVVEARRAAGRLSTRWLPWLGRRRRSASASAHLELARILGQLSEVREVRRALLGLGHNAHIRPRATPNFVAQNPGYAQTLTQDPCAPGTPTPEKGEAEGA